MYSIQTQGQSDLLCILFSTLVSVIPKNINLTSPSTIVFVCVPLKFQLFFHLNWQWVQMWSQRQTLSHWTVRLRRWFLYTSVLSTLWRQKIPEDSLVWKHWQELSCCCCHSRLHLLRLKWNVFTLKYRDSKSPSPHSHIFSITIHSKSLCYAFYWISSCHVRYFSAEVSTVLMMSNPI